MSSYSDFANAQSDLLLKRGQAEAEGIANRGRGWGQTIATIGQVAGQLPQQIQAIRAQQQTQQKQAEIARIWQESDGDVDGALEQISAIDPVLGAEFAKPIYEARKSAYEFQTLQHKAKEQETAWAMNVIGAAKDQDSWARALMTLRFAGHDVAQYPPEFDPKFQEHANRMLMTASERLKADAPKPPEEYTLGPGMKRFGAGGQVIAEVPPNPTAAAGGFALSPGQKRFDANGQEIASVPDRPSGGGGSSSEPLVPVMGPNGPVLVRRSKAEGMTPANSREQGRPVTSGDANRIKDYDTGLDDVATIKGLLTAGKTGPGAAAGAAVPDWLTSWTGWGSEAKQTQAVIDRVKQVIGKTLEGGVLRKEDEIKYAKILPKISDPPPIVKTKIAGLEAAIALQKQRQLESLADANYDVSKFEARGQKGAGQKVGRFTVEVEDP